MLSVEVLSIMKVLTTTAVATELGIKYHRLISLLRAEKLNAPQKDTSGDYIWSDADINAARKALTIDGRRKEAKG